MASGLAFHDSSLDNVRVEDAKIDTHGDEQIAAKGAALDLNLNLFVSIEVLIGDNCSRELFLGCLGCVGLCPHDLYSPTIRKDRADGLCDCMVTEAGGIVRIPKSDAMRARPSCLRVPLIPSRTQSYGQPMAVA